MKPLRLIHTIQLLLLSCLAYAAVPDEINYQGRLEDSGGNPLNATVQMAVRLYDSPSGTVPLFEEQIGSVQVVDGVYSFTFGANGSVISPASEVFATTDGLSTYFPAYLAGSPVGTAVTISDGVDSWSQATGSTSPGFVAFYNTANKQVYAYYPPGPPPAGRQIRASYNRFDASNPTAKIFDAMTGAGHYLALIVDGVESSTRTRLLVVPYAMRSVESNDTKQLEKRFNALLAELLARDIVPPEDLVTVEGGSLPNLSGLGALTVGTFLLGKHEVTWGQWQSVQAWAAGNGYDIGSAGAGCDVDHPVRAINWFDALKWCNARSEKEGRQPCYLVSEGIYRSGEVIPTLDPAANGYRLPLESEWEFAARGGINSMNYTYSGSNDINTVGWNYNNSSGAECSLDNGRGTSPVMRKLPNEAGLYDMTGNVAEWCWEREWSDAPIRGGYWSVDPFFCRLVTRTFTDAGNRLNTVGFRIVRNP